MTFVWKVCDLDLKAMPQLGDGAEKNFRPTYTIIININKTNEGSSYYSYINFNENFNVTCLLNVLYISVKYHKNILKNFKSYCLHKI